MENFYLYFILGYIFFLWSEVSVLLLHLISQNWSSKLAINKRKLLFFFWNFSLQTRELKWNQTSQSFKMLLFKGNTEDRSTSFIHLTTWYIHKEVYPSPVLTVHKRSCGKVMFLSLSVSHSVHRGVSAQCILGYTSPGRHKHNNSRLQSSIHY